jgi:hypothetical protein
MRKLYIALSFKLPTTPPETADQAIYIHASVILETSLVVSGSYHGAPRIHALLNKNAPYVPCRSCNKAPVYKGVALLI